MGHAVLQWAIGRLTEYLVKGFTMDDERLKNPPGKGQKDYFDEQLERIRDIRSSERRFYQKVLDIYATSVDYTPNTEVSQQFFATVQNKMHWAAHGQTAAEVIRQLVSKAITTEGQVIDVFTAAGFERQRRGTCQPRATSWDRVPIGSSPEGAAQPLSRPFRAWDALGDRSQGVALGWHISPLWGCSWEPHEQPQPAVVQASAGTSAVASATPGSFRICRLDSIQINPTSRASRRPDREARRSKIAFTRRSWWTLSPPMHALE